MKRWRTRRAEKARRVAPPGETSERNCTKTELRRHERRASGERRSRGEYGIAPGRRTSERRADENRGERIAANDGRRTDELHGRRRARANKCGEHGERRNDSCDESQPGSNGPDVLSARLRCRAPTVGATKTELRRNCNGVATRVASESQRSRNGVATELQRSRSGIASDCAGERIAPTDGGPRTRATGTATARESRRRRVAPAEIAPTRARGGRDGWRHDERAAGIAARHGGGWRHAARRRRAARREQAARRRHGATPRRRRGCSRR